MDKISIALKDHSGLNQWSIHSVTCIPSNQAYMGVECDFPAIIGEDDWQCHEIKESRIRQSPRKGRAGRR